MEMLESCSRKKRKRMTRIDTMCKNVGDHLTKREALEVIPLPAKRSRRNHGNALQSYLSQKSYSLYGHSHTHNDNFIGDRGKSQTETENFDEIAINHNDLRGDINSHRIQSHLKFHDSCINNRTESNRNVTFGSNTSITCTATTTSSGSVTCNQSAYNTSQLSYKSFPKLSSASSTKDISPNGAATLLSLSVSSDHNARLTLENYKDQIYNLLWKIKRYDLLPKLNRHCHKRVRIDPIEKYFSVSQCSSSAQPECNMKQPNTGRKSTRIQQLNEQQGSQVNSVASGPNTSQPKETKQTCEVKMRVKIQYKRHNHVLAHINSRKNGPDERQFDRYFQATSLLRARDTGCVVCDISFTDVTYLGAFWRDYTNGSLQEALKAVFLTEMMRQTAGDEELDVFVSVDECDFKRGQIHLLNNLKSQSNCNTNGSTNGITGIARLEL